MSLAKEFVKELKKTDERLHDLEFVSVEENSDNSLTVKTNRGEFHVCTKTQVDASIYSKVKKTIWEYEAKWIFKHSTLRGSPNKEEIIESLRIIQNEQCERSNPFILAIIENFDELLEDLVSAAGRGHFMSRYDDLEYELMINGELYFCYRVAV